MSDVVDLTCGKIVVVSPHLDDGALSLGATISRAARSGAAVTVLTVLAGDPESDAPASSWDSACGFSSAGEAATRRRQEDIRACEILGATPEWLPFWDESYGRGGGNDDVWSALGQRLAGADLVLIPGYPLLHRDHAWLTSLLLARLPPNEPVGLYVEQPYAADSTIGRGYSPRLLLTAMRVALRTRGAQQLLVPRLVPAISGLIAPPIEWLAVPSARRDRTAKAAAIGAYSSQILGRRVSKRIQLYDRGRGGEGIGVRTSSETAPPT